MNHAKLRVALAAPLLCLAWAQPAQAGAKISVADDKFMSLGLFLQPQLHVFQTEETESDWGVDPYMRRMRILMAGQLSDKVRFFAETDNPNFGKNGDFSGNMFMQDAWVEWNVHQALQLDAGLLLVPFSHHTMQGAITLLTLDYHGGVVKYPAGTVWRDVGVMARGELLNKKVEYRLCVTNGVETQALEIDAAELDSDGNPTGTTTTAAHPGGAINPNDAPRFTGRLTLNVFDSEAGPGAGGFFYDGLYLKEVDGKLTSPKKALSIGAGIDFQPGVTMLDSLDESGAVVGGELSDYMAIAIDAFADIPIGEDASKALNAQVDYYMWNYGDGAGTTANGLLAEAGFRIQRVEPVFSFEWLDYAAADDADYNALLGGINWWYRGHNMNLKAQVGASSVGGGDYNLAMALQNQFYF